VGKRNISRKLKGQRRGDQIKAAEKKWIRAGGKKSDFLVANGDQKGSKTTTGLREKKHVRLRGVQKRRGGGWQITSHH